MRATDPALPRLGTDPIQAWLLILRQANEELALISWPRNCILSPLHSCFFGPES